MASSGNTTAIQCHYDVLQVDRDADAAIIKKAHRKLALQYHPDKNSDEDSTHKFRLIQQAYECLSDPAERKWYDQHREAILRGWSADNTQQDGVDDILFDVVPFQHPAAYDGYSNDDEHGFYSVYRGVFQQIFENEERGWTSEGNIEQMPLHDHLPTDFGDNTTEWKTVAAFYKSWESFSSCLSFAWTDEYDTREAPSRQVRRAMEDENKKKRRAAKKERNEDILALLHFVKRRDPRVKAHNARVQEEKRRKHEQQVQEVKQRKAQTQEKREAWRAEAEQTMAEFEEDDRLAGRVRLADLDDDYEYGGGKRGKKGKKKNKKKVVVESESDTTDQDRGENGEGDNKSADDGEADDSSSHQDEAPHISSDASNDPDSEISYESASSEESEESEPDVWRCECCRKDFKSQGQMENHLKSKKYKEAFKKYQNKMKEQGETMDDLLDELALDP